MLSALIKITSTKNKIGKTKGKGKGKKETEMENLDLNKEPVQVKLDFKKYVYDNKNRMIQSWKLKREKKLNVFYCLKI